MYPRLVSTETRGKETFHGANSSSWILVDEAHRRYMETGPRRSRRQLRCQLRAIAREHGEPIEISIPRRVICLSAAKQGHRTGGCCGLALRRGWGWRSVAERAPRRPPSRRPKRRDYPSFAAHQREAAGRRVARRARPGPPRPLFLPKGIVLDPRVPFIL